MVLNMVSPLPPVLPYNSAMRMRDLIADNSLLLKVISRFGIALGFGNKTVSQVCDAKGIDTPTLLCVANFISGRPADIDTVSLTELMGYLQRAHSYFLDFMLPDIRRRLISVIGCSSPDEVGFLVLRFYDEYVQEVRAHMEYENARVFGYVRQLLAGYRSAEFSIEVYASHHDAIATRLADLKDVIIRYYPGTTGNDTLMSALYDIIDVERDLVSHCEVEDKIFVPAVERLEVQCLQSRVSEDNDCCDPGTDGDKLSVLSERERDIIRLIATGLSNKEVADALCISVHTETTHRRNISAKLDIHSTAGLTLFAVIHHIVNLDDVSI